MGGAGSPVGQGVDQALEKPRPFSPQRTQSGTEGSHDHPCGLRPEKDRRLFTPFDRFRCSSVSIRVHPWLALGIFLRVLVPLRETVLGCSSVLLCVLCGENGFAAWQRRRQRVTVSREADGEMAEWPIAPVLKTGSCASGTGVRIPLSPKIPPFWKRCTALFPPRSVAWRLMNFYPLASQGDAHSELFSFFPELGIDTYGPLPVSFSTVEEGWTSEARMI